MIQCKVPYRLNDVFLEKILMNKLDFFFLINNLKLVWKLPYISGGNILASHLTNMILASHTTQCSFCLPI